MVATLTSGPDSAPVEVRGWTLSVAVEGWAVGWAGVEALGNLPATAAAVEDAFTKTEFAYEAAPGSGCEGRSGVVQCVALSPAGPGLVIEPSGRLDLLLLPPGADHP